MTFGSFFIDAEHKLKGSVAHARMITAIIEHVIRFRWIVWCLVAVLIALSVYALRTAALDAIPDISDPQVIIYTKWPRSPQVIETEVTEPIIRALAGSPDIQSIRGTSHMGYSFIYVILQDPGRRAAVRQFAADRLNAIRSQLPPDANVTIGPNASSMGWIYQYALVDREGTHDLRELRLLNESLIEPALQSTPGDRRRGVGRRTREAVPGEAVSAAAQRAGHFAAAGARVRSGRVSGDRRPHHRDHEPGIPAPRQRQHRRIWTSSSSSSSAGTRPGSPCT